MIAEEYGIVLILILLILHLMYTYSSLMLTYLSCFTPVSAMNEKTYDMHSADNVRWD